MPKNTLFHALLALLIAVPWSATAAASPQEDFAWLNGLKTQHFGDREIVEDDLITLEVPKRAEDAALVPVKITAKMPQTAQNYIKTVSLVIDNNPGPLAARFHLTPNSGRADLAMRVRVNAYTPIRAIAETNDGKLHMARHFIKASGGCSAPAAGNLEAALTRLGKMKFKARDLAINQPTLAQLSISHPNVTGLQMDQVSHLYEPAHFVNEVRVSFNGETVLTAETDIAISEDPNFRFYFVPDRPGEVTVEVTDNQAQRFSKSFQVGPQS